jgi:hypothetical protein
LTIVSNKLVLLEKSGSKIVDETTPVFVIVPATFGVTTRVTVTIFVVSVGILSKSHMISCVPEQDPWEGLMADRETEEWSVSVSVTVSAGSGPRLVMRIVYEKGDPT